MSVFNGRAENIEDNRNKTNEIAEADEIKYPSCKAVIEYVNKNVENNASVNYVNNNFANALKGNKTSTGSLTLDDVSPIEHELKIKVSSKNLIRPPSYYANNIHTHNGIEFTNNKDGIITVNGTATNVANFLCQGVEWEKQMPIPKGTYTLSGTTKNTRLVVGMRSNETDTRTTKSTELGGTLTFTIDNDTTRIDIVVTVNRGLTVTNEVVKPQLEIGTTPTDYSPYVNVSDWTLFVTDGGKIEDETTKRQYCTINEDGTVDGAKSYYPITSVWNNAEGQNPTFTEVEYNRDINKAFEETLNRLAALENAIVNS